MPYTKLFLKKQDEEGNDITVLNPNKKDIKPFFLVPDEDQYGVMSLGAAVGDKQLSPVTVTQEGPNLITAFIADSDSFRDYGDHRCLVSIRDSASDRNLMNRSVHANTIFGTPEEPMVLPEFYFLDAISSFTVSLENLVATANDVKPNFSATKMYPTRAKSVYIEKIIEQLDYRSTGTLPHFLTTTEDIELDGDASDTYYFPSDSESFTEIFKISIVGYDEDDQNPNLNGMCRFELKDAETGQNLHPNTVTSENAMGTGTRPYIYSDSYLILPKQRTRIDITNITPNSHSAKFYITMIGRKIYVESI